MKKATLRYVLAAVGAGSAFVLLLLVAAHLRRPPRGRQPRFLTFSELKILSENPHPGGALERKLAKFWRSPMVSNEAYYRGIRPKRSVDPKLGPYLRLVSWNIEKSYRLKDAIAAFASPDSFRRLIDTAKAAEDSPEYADILRQREKLAGADIIVLQEMDIGVKRSDYIDAARELARALGMNYAFGTEYLEVDPVYLGLEPIYFEEGAVDQEATDYFAVDPARYRGAFGCAVLSRYPIRYAEVLPLNKQAYDWHSGEKPKIGFLEKVRRAGSKTIFQNELTREIKVGGRIFFRVDLEVPGLPQRRLTVVNVHVEIKCLPEGRQAQMSEILSHISGLRHPVIVAGDLNSAPHDLSPTSLWRVAERTAKNPETWLSVATSALLPQALVVNTTRMTSNITKNLQDPLAPHIAVVAPNPVRPMFKMIENFRFDDGGAFDFRGDPGRSVNGSRGVLANSNQRDRKGFKTTFSVKRPLAVVIGKYRLDWVFVKSHLKEPRDAHGSYRFAPHFGETLEELNTGLLNPISDHHPIVVDLPFEEPELLTES